VVVVMARQWTPPEPLPGEEPDERNGDFWGAHERLKIVRDWARARRVAPHALLAEILAQIACRVPPHVQLPPTIGGPGSLNSISALVARSGIGKGAAQAAARVAVAWPPSPDTPAVVPLGSGEGIPATYAISQRNKETGDYEVIRLRWSAMFVVREVDKFAALATRKGATLAGTLREVWSGEDIGFGNAGADRRLILAPHSYRAVVTIGVQPGRAGALLDDEDGGTPQRIWWVPAADPDIPDSRPDQPAPIGWQLPEQLRLAIGDVEVAWPDRFGLIEPAAFPVWQGALDEIDAAAVARHRGQVDALDGHALQCREKIAAHLGLFLGHFEVTKDDWQLAGHLMRVSDSTRAGISDVLRRAEDERNDARGRAEARRAQIVRRTEESDVLLRASQRAMKVLRDRQDWMSRSDLRREAGSRYRDYLDDAVEQLLKEGEIEFRDTSRADGGHGGTGIQYRINTDGNPGKNRGGPSTPVCAVA
jgi:hypothetical protein